MLNPLDYNSFPHIVDLVVACADLSVKIAFRATARQFRDKVDSLIFQHVAISSIFAPGASAAPRKRGFTARSNSARLPFEQLVEMRDPGYPLFRKLPFLPWRTNFAEDDLIPRAETLDLDGKGIPGGHDIDAQSTMCATLASRYRQLSHVRVVDYYPFRDHPAVVQLPQLLLHVEVLRRRLPLPTWIKAATVVDYLNITSSICHRTGHVPFARINAPDGCTRYVLHISFDPSHPYLGMASPVVTFNVLDVAIVLTAQSVAPIEGHPVNPADDTLPPLGFLEAFMRPTARALDRSEGRAKIQFVGVERFPPGYLGLDPSLEGAAVVEQVRSLVHDRVRTFTWGGNGGNAPVPEPTFPSHWAENVTFATLEEWRARTPPIEAVPALALPDINEDAQDAEWWAMDAALGDFGPTQPRAESPPGSPPLHGF